MKAPEQDPIVIGLPGSAPLALMSVLVLGLAFAFWLIRIWP